MVHESVCTPPVRRAAVLSSNWSLCTSRCGQFGTCKECSQMLSRVYVGASSARQRYCILCSSAAPLRMLVVHRSRQYQNLMAVHNVGSPCTHHWREAPAPVTQRPEVVLLRDDQALALLERQQANSAGDAGQHGHLFLSWGEHTVTLRNISRSARRWFELVTFSNWCHLSVGNW